MVQVVTCGRRKSWSFVAEFEQEQDQQLEQEQEQAAREVEVEECRRVGEEGWRECRSWSISRRAAALSESPSLRYRLTLNVTE